MVPERMARSSIGPTAVRVSRETGRPTCGEQPAHDVLAPLVQHDLDHRLAGVGVDDPERVDLHRAVVELDARRAAGGARSRGTEPLNLGEVGLAHLVGGVGQPVGQLAVVGEQQQALGVLVEPADVHQALGQVADHVADGRAGCGRRSSR